MARSTYFDLGRSEDARPGSESAMPNVFNLKILSNAQFGREWFHKVRTFRGDSAFATWLYRLAVNTVLMKRRRHKSPPMLSLDAPVSSDSSSLRGERSRFRSSTRPRGEQTAQGCDCRLDS